MADDQQLDELKSALKNLAEQQQQMIVQQKDLLGQLSAARKKDFWEKIGAIAPILSGAIIAIGGTIFTISFNQQQLKLQEAQTIEKFIPHLLGTEKSKRAAILAISSLTDPKLAARVAAIFASPGTVSALESIAENEPGADRKALKNTLARALDNMAERYRMDKQYEDAIATYKKALELHEQQAGFSSPELIPGLDRIAELCSIHKDYAQAETVLRRAADIEKTASGAESTQYAAQLRRLASLYKEQGLDSKSTSVLNQAIAIEQKSPATAAGAAVVVAPELLEKDANPLSSSNTDFATDKSAKPLEGIDGKPAAVPVDAGSKVPQENQSKVIKPAPEMGSQESLRGADLREPELLRTQEISETRPAETFSDKRR